MNHKDSWDYPVSGHRYMVGDCGLPKHPGRYELDLVDGRKVISDIEAPEIMLDIGHIKAWKLLHKS